jgi:hypothetical protein
MNSSKSTNDLPLDLQQRLVRLERQKLQLAQRELWEWMLSEETSEIDSLNCFMFKFAKTFDPLDQTTPSRYFPEKAYLRDLNRIWTVERLLAVPKSRQIMGSWWGVTDYTWDAIRNPGRVTLFKSVDKRHSGLGKLCLLWRAQFLVEQLPICIRPKLKIYKRDLIIEFVKNGSIIQAMSMEARDPRTFTATGVLDDETAIQQYAEAGYASVLPLLGTIGRYTAVSTYMGLNFFYRLVFDKMEK